jgi:hypothetical protein
LFGWQYNGDGEGYLAHYPQTTPLGPEDTSVLLLGAESGDDQASLGHMRQPWPRVAQTLATRLA